jgi:5-methylcytosine-specific restriction endonuclease McrA
MYKKYRYIIICLHCKKEHKVGDRRVKYCSIACYNTHTKTKDIDGYKSCEICKKQIPFRYSLKVRAYGNIASIKTRFCSNECKSYWRCYLENPAKTESGRNKISTYAKSRSNFHLWTKEAIEKRIKTISGKNHWNWQGGITTENKRRRNLAEYRDWRIAVFERDHYTCQICKSINGNGKTIYLQADHIKPWCNFPELRLDINNGRTLCIECHKKTDTYGTKAKKMI